MNQEIHALVVDDEEKARLYLAAILSDLYPDFHISLAASPVEAQFMLKKQSFDLAFFDVEMQGMTGLDMLRELQDEKNSLPVIFVSAYKKADFIQSALRLKAVDYLDKPVDPNELRVAVEKAISGSYSRAARFPDDRFCLLTDVGERFVDIDEIAYFQSEKRYAKVFFVDGTSNIVRTNLVHLMEMLPQTNFLHVGRKYIANVNFIKYISRSNKTLTLIFGNEKVVLDTIFPEVLTRLISKSHILK